MATSTRKVKSQSQSGKKQDAIALLMEDHKKVKKLFGAFKKLHEQGESEEKAAVVEQICNELKIHTAIEEEIFYPAVRKAIDDADLMDEALVEHAGAKDLIAQLEEAGPEADLYDAKVTVLSEQIDQHVKEEEKEMFPMARKSKIDLDTLGAQMLRRKQSLMAEMDLSGDEDEGEEDEEDAAEAAPRRRSAR
jgi:hemerythrin-like domain-containing protein